MIRTVTQDGPPRRRARPNSASRRAFGKSSFSRVTRIPRNVGGPGLNSVHRFTKLAQGDVLTNDLGFGIGASVSNRFSIQFNMQSATFAINNTGASITYNIPGFVELSALFDQIMIEKVVVKFTFNVDPQVIQQPGAAAMPQGAPVLYHAVDFNDAAVPASVTDIMQYSSVQSKLLGGTLGPIVRSVRPMFAQIVYASAIGNSYRASRGFLQKDVDVPHYGVKGFITTPNANIGGLTTGKLSLEFKYYYACKNVI